MPAGQGRGRAGCGPPGPGVQHGRQLPAWTWLPCAGEDGLPADAAAAEALRGALRALEALRHPDGTPVYLEETRPLLGSRALRMEAERPKQRRWNGVDDPISHCLAGNSLLLTGLPGTGKTRLARTIVARLARAGQGGAPRLKDALLRAEPGPGGADGRPLGAQERAARKSWTGSRSWTWRSGRTWPVWG